MSISTCALREEGDPAIIKITASHSGFLSTPSARRATVSFCWFPKTANYFYPHPPRGGRRQSSFLGCSRFLFLSTPSARRATGSGIAGSTDRRISIHALREEGDRHGLQAGDVQVEISIHALREEGDAPIRQSASLATNFYPRPPRGGRRRVPGARSGQSYFYPRPPRGGRPGRGRYLWPCQLISIHALREEGDVQRGAASDALYHFYPRPPRGGRPLS